MHYLEIFLRFLHVVGGAFWYGSAMVMGLFIGPTVAAIGDAGPKFMSHLILEKKLHRTIAVAAGMTAVGGAGLYWIDSAGFTSDWVKSGPGIVFGIGGIFGIVAFIYGNILGANIKKVATIGAEAKGNPSQEQMNLIQAGQKTIAKVGPVSTFCLVISVICMAVARYWF